MSSAADTLPATNDLPVVTGYADYSHIPEFEWNKEHRLRMEATVLVYDRTWNLLWLESDGHRFYCNPGTDPFDIQAGQRILLEGTVFPSNSLEPQNLQITVLGDAPPLEPKSALSFLDYPNELDLQRIQFSGFVESQLEVDSEHILLEVPLGRFPAHIHIIKDPGEPARQFAGQRVSVDGFATAHRSPGGEIEEFYIFAANQRQIQPIGPLTTDRRFLLPLSSGKELHLEEDGQWVRVEGVVREILNDGTIVLWDENDQIKIRPARTARPALNDAITAFGRLQKQQLQLVLEDGLWMSTTHSNSTSANQTLHRAVEVLELSPAEAGRNHPVSLQGVVTWSSPQTNYFFLQDSTRGVCIFNNPTNNTPPPAIGTTVQITGHTANIGTFSPVVESEKITVAGALNLPAPRSVTLEQSINGAEEAKYVRIDGYLRAVRTTDTAGQSTILELATPTGTFEAKLPGFEHVDTAARQIGSVVQLNGVCVAQINTDGQHIGIKVLLGSWEDVRVITPPLPDPFMVDSVSMETLLRFGPLQAPFRWVRTEGVVIYTNRNQLVLQSGSIGMEIFCADAVEVAPGEKIEVAGFAGRYGHQVVLREARLRSIAETKPPNIVAWSVDNPINIELNNRLVQVDATLEDVLHEALHLSQDDLHFLGYGNLPPKLSPGSLLRCTGVYRIEQNLLGQPEEFKLLFRRPDDIVVLEPPPLLTLKNALLAVLIISIGTGATLLWVVLLKKRLHIQTQEIRDHLEHEASLEAKTAKLESLGLLAGGIAHDFNNLLQVITGNITLAKLDPRAVDAAGECLDEAERGAMRARDLTHQLLTFAKGGEPLRAAEVLPEIVRESAEFVLRGSNVRCDYNFAARLWPADVDRGQIGQVVHNLVLNARQAMPDGGVIAVKARNERLQAGQVSDLQQGRYITLSIADTGPGISPEELDRLFDPYFTTKKTGNGLGLATVHSIVRRHRGHIEVHSELGHGTVFNIWLRAAEGPAEEDNEQTTPAANTLHGRVLVMDDEDSVRRMIVALLKRYGMDAVGAPDGALAVQLYQQALDDGNPFALTIMDLTVPGGMGGAEAMEKLREIDPYICAIVSSGYSNDPVMANYKEYGFAAMVEKPYEVSKLIDSVSRLLPYA